MLPVILAVVRGITIATGIAVVLAIRFRRFFLTPIAAITVQITPVIVLQRLQEAINLRRHLHPHRLHQAAQAAVVEVAVVVQAGQIVNTRNKEI